MIDRSPDKSSVAKVSFLISHPVAQSDVPQRAAISDELGAASITGLFQADIRPS
jgi:hypothetical protein